MRMFTKRAVERVIALANHRRRVDVERRAVLLAQLLQGHVFAVENKRSVPARGAVVRLATDKDKSGGTRCRWALTTRSHFFLGGVCAPPCTLMATTVWSSNVSTPAECSAAALNRESTTQFADLLAHSETICSTRPRRSEERRVGKECRS